VTYSSAYVYHTAKGVFGASAATPVENWQVGLKIPTSSASLITPATLTSFMSNVKAAWTAWIAPGGGNIGTNVFLTDLTYAHVDTDGTYVGGGVQTTTVFPVTPAVAGTGVTTAPYAQAMVCSLRTAYSRGRASNGRIYSPFGAGIQAGTGCWTTGQASSRASATAVLLDAINTAFRAGVDPAGSVSVMSQLGTGLTAPVLSVRCGIRPDHMESRESKLVETYQTADLASTLLIRERRADVTFRQLALDRDTGIAGDQA
jgi:hypothetical protein